MKVKTVGDEDRGEMKGKEESGREEYEFTVSSMYMQSVCTM